MATGSVQAVRQPSQKGILHDLRQALAGGYLIILFGLVFNRFFDAVGLPAISSETGHMGSPLGSDGFHMVALVAPLVVIVSAVSGGIGRRHLLGFGATASMPVALALALLIKGQDAAGALSWALIAAALTTSVIVLSPHMLLKAWFVGGGLWAWASIMLTVLTMIGAVDLRTLEVDPAGRYAQWLSVVGLSAPEGIGAMVGLSTHRQTLGPAMALLLIGQLVALRSAMPHSPLERRLAWVAVAGCGIALFMTMSRTGILAAAFGLAAAFLLRVRTPRSAVLLSVLSLLAVLAPLLGILRTWSLPQGTLNWRLDLWRQSMEVPGLFTILGPDPVLPPPLKAAHVHNLPLELLAVGGFLGLLGLVTFFLCSWLVVTKAPSARAQAVAGVTVALCIMGQFEVPFTSRVQDVGMLFPLVVCVIAFATAALPRQESQQVQMVVPERHVPAW